MAVFDLSVESLALWRERRVITGVEAAYLLAGKTPVQNPSPSMPGSIRDMYRHILYAVKSGELSTVDGVHERIEVDSNWLNSLSAEDYVAWFQPWQRLHDVDSIDIVTNLNRYRFRVKSIELFEWAKRAGWGQVSNICESDEPNTRWWYVVPLRWAFASGRLERNESPTRILNLIKTAMDRYGVEAGYCVNPRASAQQESVKIALSDCAIDFNQALPSNRTTIQIAAQLFIFAAQLHGFKEVTDEEALFNAIKSDEIEPPSTDQLARLTTEM